MRLPTTIDEYVDQMIQLDGFVAIHFATNRMALNVKELYSVTNGAFFDYNFPYFISEIAFFLNQGIKPMGLKEWEFKKLRRLFFYFKYTDKTMKKFYEVYFEKYKSQN